METTISIVDMFSLQGNFELNRKWWKRWHSNNEKYSKKLIYDIAGALFVMT